MSSFAFGPNRNLLLEKDASDINSPLGKVAATQLRAGFPFELMSGGSSVMDPRAMTIDTPLSSQWPERRAFGRRRSLPPPITELTKTTAMNCANAIGHPVNLDMVPRRRRSVGDMPCTPRTKMEVTAGMPLSGRGADISHMGGRRLHGFPASPRSESEARRDAKLSFDGFAIEHQHGRRHYSCPPPSHLLTDTRRDVREELEHVKRSEDYARLLGRSESQQYLETGKQKAPWNRFFQPPLLATGRHNLLSDLESLPLASVDTLKKQVQIVMMEDSRAASVTSEVPSPCTPSVDCQQEMQAQATPTSTAARASPLYVKHLHAPNSWMSDTTADPESPESCSGTMTPNGTESTSVPSTRTDSLSPKVFQSQPFAKNLAMKKRQEKLSKFTPAELKQAQRRAAWV